MVVGNDFEFKFNDSAIFLCLSLGVILLPEFTQISENTAPGWDPKQNRKIA